MEKVKSRNGAAFPRRLSLKITKFYRRHLNITPVGKISIPTCGHPRASVRNVVELDGEAVYLCRSCFARLRAVEFRTIVRDRFASIFRNLWPHGIFRGAVDYLLARAMLAAFRDRSYRPWIALARLAARVAERGAT